MSVPGATKACVRWVNAPAIRRFDSPVYDRSKRRVGTGSVIFACLLLGSVAFAAEASIEEMVISGVMINPRPVQATQYRLEDLEQVRPLALPDILLQAPGAVVGTNSRGETLVQFRNGSERQTQLFFDGAPLTVPWDQRLDLSLVPTTALGRVVVTTGPSSVCFGPNSAGGVIELVPAAPLDQPIAEGRLEGGQGGLVVADGFGAVRTGDLLVSLGAGHRRQNGAPLARDLPFSQPEDDLRLNTDLRRTNALARLAYDGGQAGSVAASLLYVRGGFGIAPESAFSPEAVAVRFWRYPDVEHWAAVLHGERPIGQTIYLTTTAWAQNFDQRIDSFADADYALLEDRQDDDNFTWGGRATLRYESDATTVRLHAQGLTSEHVQTDTAFTAAVPLEQTDRFAQRLFTFGAEAEQRFGDTVVLAGLSGNRFIPTATGGRPDSGTFAGIEAVAGVRGHWGAAGLWRVSAGRKVRFPTLRELFDTAIDRFLINPDLKPERAYLAEAELGWQTASADLAGELVVGLGERDSHGALAFARQRSPVTTVSSISEITLNTREVAWKARWYWTSCETSSSSDTPLTCARRSVRIAWSFRCTSSRLPRSRISAPTPTATPVAYSVIRTPPSSSIATVPRAAIALASSLAPANSPALARSDPAVKGTESVTVGSSMVACSESFT